MPILYASAKTGASVFASIDLELLVSQAAARTRRGTIVDRRNMAGKHRFDCEVIVSPRLCEKWSIECFQPTVFTDDRHQPIAMSSHKIRRGRPQSRPPTEW